MTSPDRTTARSLRHALLVGALLAAGCGGGSDTPVTPPNTPGAPASVVVTIPAPTLTLGDSAQAIATVRDAGGNVLKNAAVTWSSSATSLLRVDPTTGIARAITFAPGFDTASVIATVAGGPGSSTRLTIRPGKAPVVGMLPNAFVPPTLYLARGDSVLYDFPTGIQHNVIFPKRANEQPLVAGAPSDILPTQGRRVARVFNTAGTFTYDCMIHPGMSGEVIVVP